MSPILAVQGLGKRFQGLVANTDIAFTLQPGEIRSIIGPNGAGKTTFISLISGHLTPTTGRILYKGSDVTGLSVARRAQLGIARKFQTPSLFDSLSAYENIELAVLRSRPRSRGHAARIGEVLELVRLADQRHAVAKHLSHGQRQWLEIGLLLANNAELLLLDEPTAGMTAEETHATGILVRSLAREFGLSAIIIEHDINFIRDLDAPVTVLHLGRVLVEGSFAAVAADPRVRDVYLGNG
ncbi:ATP-binding cassette domain-containing protein [Benzoatithermus flavus]|uniref:ATP-binding cassette domain-containing protein n=1 Tax=Benzoatithermus flavus TaxID=3108223 RepID=A0ABU8XU91_9PROT